MEADGQPVNQSDTESGHRTGAASCTQTITVNDVTPPTITPPANQTASADANCQFALPDYTSQASVSDNCACDSNTEDCQGRVTITVSQSPAPGTLVGLGTTTITLTANDGSSNNNGAGNSSINCPANIVASTDPGVCYATVNPGTATATDNCDNNPTIAGHRSDNQALNAPYPKGTTTSTWTATDASGNSSSCTQTVTVNDTEPPVITFNGQTPSMWPPNHSYHTFTPADFISSVSDNCGGVSISDVSITSATSDEAEDDPLLGDGNTLNDIVIASNCKSIQLRAERVNSGNGRVYTIYFKLKDTSGNVTTGSAKVYSPKNQGETSGDDGPHYTVNSSCP